jgi:hypothetical protein
MHERLKLYLAEHLDDAVNLYLLTSEAVNRRTEWGTGAITAEPGEERDLFVRLKRVRDGIAEGISRSGLYLRP